MKRFAAMFTLIMLLSMPAFGQAEFPNKKKLPPFTPINRIIYFLTFEIIVSAKGRFLF